MLGDGALHLDLHLAVLRIDVVELLHVGLAHILFRLAVQVFADPQVIECHGSYVELGATANDVCAGNLTGSMTILTLFRCTS